MKLLVYKVQLSSISLSRSLGTSSGLVPSCWVIRRLNVMILFRRKEIAACFLPLPHPPQPWNLFALTASFCYNGCLRKWRLECLNLVFLFRLSHFEPWEIFLCCNHIVYVTKYVLVSNIFTILINFLFCSLLNLSILKFS